MAWQSKLTRHKKKESRKQVFLYLFLSVVFLFVMVKWGLPLLIEVVSSGDDGGARIEENNVPVQSPTLKNLPEATPSGVIKIEGSALPKQRIRLYLNDSQTDEKPTDDQGDFVFEYVSLKSGENKIGVQAIDETDRESQIREVVVILDNKNPSLEILEPKEEAIFYGSDQQRIEIKGKVDEKAEVTVNDNFVAVGSEGNFTYRTKLSVGINEFVVVAVDIAGNRVERLLRVTFSL